MRRSYLALGTEVVGSARRIRLLRVRWSHQGREEVLALARDEVKIGRGAEIEIVLPDFSVSRRHAALRRESEGWALHDLASTNGVQVNRVTVKRALVRAGDRIKVGIFELQLEEAADSIASLIDSAPTSPDGVAAPAMGTATIVRSIAGAGL